MSLNSTPFAERVHIGFFGKRNAGKSSVVNAVAGQELAVVSEVSGTTTGISSKRHHDRSGAKGNGAAARRPCGDY